MPSFSGGPNYFTPFGRNVFLRSTQDLKTLSATCAASTITSQTIDSYSGQKILQPGTLLAKITSGADAGKVGPFQPVGGNAVETVTITGAPTGGTFTLTLAGSQTAPIAFNATAATVQAALEALPDVTPGGVDLTVTGNGPYVVTYQQGGRYDGFTPVLTASGSGLTGGTSPAAAESVTTAGGTAAGATDGRGLVANVVGLCNTFLPWTLKFRDVEVAVVVDCLAVQAWCLMYDANGNYIPLDDETAGSLRTKTLNLRFV